MTAQRSEGRKLSRKPRSNNPYPLKDRKASRFLYRVLPSDLPRPVCAFKDKRTLTVGGGKKGSAMGASLTIFATDEEPGAPQNTVRAPPVISIKGMPVPDGNFTRMPDTTCIDSESCLTQMVYFATSKPVVMYAMQVRDAALHRLSPCSCTLATRRAEHRHTAAQPRLPSSKHH